MRKLIISCGGTGGHFMPGLSIAREFQEQGGVVLLLLGGKNAKQQMETAAKYHIPSFTFPAAPPSKSPVKLLRFGAQTMAGFASCLKAIRKFQPDALLAMGSFASLSPVLAAKTLKVPVFLHDGNAKLGKANLKLSRFARSIVLSFPTVNANQAKCPAILTGFPLRQELISNQLPKQEAIRELNQLYQADLSPEKPTILVFGGSLGAETINKKLVIAGDPPETKNLQFLRLTGPGKLESCRELYEKQNCKVFAMESSREMHLFYSAADLVISRSGGSTVSELACFGKYAILLPFPYAAENHQEDNAQWLASAGGAEILHDRDADETKFTAWILDWLKRKEEFLAKGENSKSLARPNAAKEVISMISNIINLPDKGA